MEIKVDGRITPSSSIGHRRSSDSGTETSSMKRKSEDLAYRPEKGNNIYLIWTFNGFGFRFYLLNTLSIFTLIKHN